MAEYVVTGGAGFIGSNICEELVARGHSVCAYDDLSTGKLENLRDIMDRIEFMSSDVRSAPDLEKAMEGASYVLHQAAIPSVPRSIEEPLYVNDVNVIGTLNVLECARKLGIRRVVFASSSSVYGDSETLPKHEGMPCAPKSPYAVTKAVGEHYCALYSSVYGVPVVSLRYFNVFGPRQDSASQYSGVISKFAAGLLEGKTLTIYGDGRQSRDFTYISDVVEANLSACVSPKAPGRVINIGAGGRITVNDLVAALAEITGKKPDVEYAEPRPGDVLHSEADISAARELLGYEIRTGFKEGLKKTVEWFSSAGRIG
jgi:nucleoside-diphosphate-sugar epimerase